MGMAATFNRFISWSANMCRPFFQLLHRWKDFQWTKECMLAFEELKQYLLRPLILSRPEKEEVFYAYLAVTDYAVSLVLVKNKNGVQKPVYCVSKSLQESETRYLPLERRYWSLCMPPGNFLIISRHIMWWYLLSSHCKHSYERWTTRAELPSGEPCWVLMMSSICLVLLRKDKY